MADATADIVFNRVINRESDIALTDPTDIPEGMSSSELNARLERGYNQALAGQGKSVDEVFNNILGGRG